MTPQEKLITSCIPLVRYFARCLVQDSGRVGREDAESDGYVALVQAAHAFEPERGVAFSAFASIRIRGAIVDSLRRAEPHSRQIRDNLRRYDAVWSELAIELGREPEPAEVAARLGTGRREARALMESRAIRTLHLWEAGREAEEKGGSEGPAEEAAIDRIQAEFIRRMVASLPHREREVVVRRYFHGDTMVSISRCLGVSSARACEIHRRALSRLRKMVAETKAVDAA